MGTLVGACSPAGVLARAGWAPLVEVACFMGTVVSALSSLLAGGRCC